ncbi:MAG: DUF2330 domain-containing protein [Spirulina sp. SIO3F2]|nr:DUF2330 domain-containing protein [Spirulina sp. SIO3F2]
MKPSSLFIPFSLILLLLVSFVPPAAAFCGFFVSQADTSLFNQASEVIIARDHHRTILTIANDYQGEVQDFALVVPVPVAITEDQVQVGDPKILQRLDEFTAPRLVEYFDSDPCTPQTGASFGFSTQGGIGIINFGDGKNAAPLDNAALLGVTIEDRFSIGEYDILLLSAKESEGLETWLRQNNYQLPEGASKVLHPYIRQDFKFFVAKINLAEFEQSEFQALRPLQIAYESPRFSLPIRLGMLNAQGAQDLIVYALTPTGRVELTNYRTVPIPSDVNIPEFVEDEFGAFYQALFQTSYETENKEVAFLEYAWDMSWCDPCAANPLTPEELRQAGVFWLPSPQARAESQPNAATQSPSALPPFPVTPLPSSASPVVNLSSPVQQNPTPVHITRLHVRYARDKFPEDLRFQTTGNRENYQGRYVIQRPYREAPTCDVSDYRASVRDRQSQELETLAQLTGWDKKQLHRKVDWLEDVPLVKPQGDDWWRDLFSTE